MCWFLEDPVERTLHSHVVDEINHQHHGANETGFS